MGLDEFHTDGPRYEGEKTCGGMLYQIHIRKLQMKNVCRDGRKNERLQWAPTEAGMLHPQLDGLLLESCPLFSEFFGLNLAYI